MLLLILGNAFSEQSKCFQGFENAFLLVKDAA